MKKGEEYPHLDTADQISLGCSAHPAVKDAGWCQQVHTDLPALGPLIPTAETDFPKSSPGK